ncbi:Hypothetical protein DPCES_5395 [Desulfitobacterium hafniense]|uniref:Uncharacterized protein n=1 Tax=Desulfitobacterium hafniense TaxID=49338 RepID=A0A098AUZ0_DESHA|nr:hypothetical protein [Desulfitobacterium hafniense]CDV96393.1 Hypothetical protein DPCES_5395 [Desulfitobacterium hafniense]
MLYLSLREQLADKTALLDAAIAGQEILQKALAQSQRREKAAVDDLIRAGACFSCKHFLGNEGRCSGAGKCRVMGVEIFPCDRPGVYRIEIPDDGRDTYEWRGPQDAEEENDE